MRQHGIYYMVIVLSLLCILPFYLFYYALDGLLDNTSFDKKKSSYAYQLDATKYYLLGKMAVQGDKNLWNVDNQAKQYSNLFACPVSYFPAKNGSMLFTPAQYTPQLCCIMLFLSKLKLFSFLRIWLVFIAILPVLLFLFVIKKLYKPRVLEYLLWSLVIIDFEPYYLNFIPGQTGALVAAFLTLYFYLFTAQKKFLAALSLVPVALLKPHFLVVPLVMLVITKHFRILVYFGLLGLGTILLSELMLGEGTTVDYIKSNLSITNDVLAGKYYMPYFSMASITGIFKLFDAKQLIALWYKISNLIVIAILMIIWFLVRRHKNDSTSFAFALSVMVKLVFSDYANTYDLSQIITAWIITVPSLEPSKIWALNDNWYRLWCMMVLIIPPITCVLFLATKLHSTALFPINLFLLFVILMCYINKIRRPSYG